MNLIGQVLDGASESCGLRCACAEVYLCGGCILLALLLLSVLVLLLLFDVV